MKGCATGLPGISGKLCRNRRLNRVTGSTENNWLTRGHQNVPAAVRQRDSSIDKVNLATVWRLLCTGVSV